MVDQIKRNPICDADRLRTRMEKAGIDLILASSRRNVAYLTDHQTEHWTWEHAILHMMEKEYDGADYLLFAGFPLDAAKKSFLVEYAHREEAIARRGVFADQFYGYWRKGRIPDKANVNEAGICLEQDWSRTAEEAAAQGIVDCGLEDATIGVEMPRMSAAVLERLRELLPRAKFVDAFEMLFDVRQIKTPEEIRRLQRAYTIAAEIYKDLFGFLHPGVTPREALLRELDGIYRRGASFSFAHIFFGGGDHDLAYTPPPEREIQPGDIGTLDLGVAYEGYGTDFARMAHVPPINAKFVKAYQSILKARRAVHDALRPGAKANDVFLAGARCLEADGLCASISNVGHGIGLGCHEKPFLIADSEDVIAEGQTLVIEIYCEMRGVGPLLLEDGGVVEAGGWRSFTDLPMEIVDIS